MLGQQGKILNFEIFSDSINMVNVTLCVMVALIVLYPFISLSVTLIVFQGHSSVKQFELKMLYSYPIKLKVFMILDYVK